jgi:hypothetical protein
MVCAQQRGCLPQDRHAARPVLHLVPAPLAVDDEGEHLLGKPHLQSHGLSGPEPLGNPKGRWMSDLEDLLLANAAKPGREQLTLMRIRRVPGIVAFKRRYW